jgi:hypothetical protein
MSSEYTNSVVAVKARVHPPDEKVISVSGSQQPSPRAAGCAFSRMDRPPRGAQGP